MQVCQNSAEMSKWWQVSNVKTLQVCQNSAGIFCQNSVGSVGLQTAFSKQQKRSEGTNAYNRQSKRSEFARLVSILRYVTQVDIVKVTITFCAINYLLRSIFGEKLSMNLSYCQAVREQMNTAGNTNGASLQDLCHLLGIHQG